MAKIIFPKMGNIYFVVKHYKHYTVERYYSDEYIHNIVGFISTIEMASVINKVYTLNDYATKQMKRYTPEQIKARIKTL